MNDVREIQPGDVVSKIEDGMVGIVVDVRIQRSLAAPGWSICSAFVDVHWANGLTQADARGFDRVMLPSGKSPASFAELLRDKSNADSFRKSQHQVDPAVKERLDRTPEHITIDTPDADAVRKYRDQIGVPVADAHVRVPSSSPESDEGETKTLNDLLRESRQGQSHGKSLYRVLKTSQIVIDWDCAKKMAGAFGRSDDAAIYQAYRLVHEYRTLLGATNHLHTPSRFAGAAGDEQGEDVTAVIEAHRLDGRIDELEKRLERVSALWADVAAACGREIRERRPDAEAAGGDT